MIERLQESFNLLNNDCDLPRVGSVGLSGGSSFSCKGTPSDFLFPGIEDNPRSKIYGSNDYTAVGQIGESYVLYRLRSFGHYASFASEGMPYDIIADIKGRLVRVQVKTTQKASRGSFSFFGFRGRYAKHLDRGAAKEKYTNANADLVALFALSIEKAIFVHVTKCSENMYVPVSSMLQSCSERNTFYESLECVTGCQ